MVASGRVNMCLMRLMQAERALQETERAGSEHQEERREIDD